MTPPDELTRRAEEEVAKELAKQVIELRRGGQFVLSDKTRMKLFRALSVRLMRFKLQVREAEKEMGERKATLERIELYLGASGIGEALKILTKHTQEEQ